MWEECSFRTLLARCELGGSEGILEVEIEDSLVRIRHSRSVLFFSTGVTPETVLVIFDGGLEKLKRLILHGVETGSLAGPEFGVWLGYCIHSITQTHHLGVVNTDFLPAAIIA